MGRGGAYGSGTMQLTMQTVPHEREGEPVEIDGSEWQVWSDPAVLGLDRFYLTRDGEVVESRLMREEAERYLWFLCADAAPAHRVPSR